MSGWAPGLVVMVDWSAASGRGPAREAADRCWLAWGTGGERPAPEYFRTRDDCVARLCALLKQHSGPALFGFDFPIGYPRDEQGRAVLPEGRALVEHVTAKVVDVNGMSNRFDVARSLNREIRALTGRAEGPLWGCVGSVAGAGLTSTKTRAHGVAEYRPAELRLRAQGRNIQSPWKLFGAGSVGSQSLVGLPAVERVLTQAGERGRLWPFEAVDRADAVVVAEIWPSLGDFRDERYLRLAIKDARQVAAMRDWALGRPEELQRAIFEVPAGAEVGWILGAP